MYKYCDFMQKKLFLSKNKMFKLIIILIILINGCFQEKTQIIEPINIQKKEIQKQPEPGAYSINEYLPLLKDKKVALMVNQSSLVQNKHLIDTLLQLNIKIEVIFAPEHGFRGNKEAGEYFGTYTDSTTGIKVISLFDKKKKPSAEDLQNIDIVIYDIQDVGVRFFTYISSMYLLMEACAENNKPLIIFDRPNPNGDYIAGPVLDTSKFKSFVGMLPIPIVYGLTPGELALMINGEKWLKNKLQCELIVIKCKNYNHQTKYNLPVRPSPNLPNYLSVRLYPSLCLFEATEISIGRGTEYPFQVIGYPNPIFGNFTFTPNYIKGFASNPTQKGKICYGQDLRTLQEIPKFTIAFCIDYYQKFQKENINFFSRPKWFDLLMGTDQTRMQIQKGLKTEQIEKSWQTQIEEFKKKSQKYKLYE